MSFLDRKLNPNLEGLTQSATLAINERSRKLEAEGMEVFRFGFGQSPFPVPRVVVDALRENAYRKNYLDVRGLPELRKAVAQYNRRFVGVETRPQDVLIGPGSKELMFLVQMAYPGEVILPSPSWVSYAPQGQIIGRSVRWLHTSAEQRWKVSAKQLDRYLKARAKRARIFVLNTPANPTGIAYTGEELGALSEVARKHKLLVLSDEIYGGIHFDNGHRSIAHHYPEGTIISSGLSKWCGAGGWRLGSFSFPEHLHWLLEAMATLASETYSATSAPIQYAAVRAFEGGDELELYLGRTRRILHCLAKEIVVRLRAMNVSVVEPDGAFYVFPDFSAYYDKVKARGVRTSREFCKLLLNEAGVALLPGADFGRPPEELTCRLAYVNFDGEKALEAAKKLPTAGDPTLEFLTANCGDVLRGIDKLTGWLKAL